MFEFSGVCVCYRFCNVDDDGLQLIAKHLPSLKSLDVTRGDITGVRVCDCDPE